MLGGIYMKKHRSFKFYMVLIAVWTFIMFVFQTALRMDILNVILPVIEETKGWSRGDINNIAAVSGWATLLIGVLFTTAYMKFGVKKAFPVFVTITSVATIVMGTTDSLVVFALAMTAGLSPLRQLGERRGHGVRIRGHDAHHHVDHLAG